MRKYNKGNVYITEFRNIVDLVNFIEKEKVFPNFEKNGVCHSVMCGRRRENFTGTKNFDEAMDLLLHGWEYGTKEIRSRFDVKETSVSTKQKTVYDVSGFQCSVPRYLQGIPTNMINKKNKTQKNKVITINKMCSYSCNVSAETIKEESVKVLQLVNNLEKQGYRVKLNVLFGCKELNKSIIKVCIKTSSQKLNIKQTVFPLVHPSMLRRIIFAVLERSEECSYGGFENGYGKPCNYGEYVVAMNNGEYLIPNILNEKQILDVEKYKINLK